MAGDSEASIETYPGRVLANMVVIQFRWQHTYRNQVLSSLRVGSWDPLIQLRNNACARYTPTCLGESHRSINRADEFAPDHSADGSHDLGGPRWAGGLAARAAGLLVGRNFKPGLSTRILTTRLEGYRSSVYSLHRVGHHISTHRSPRSVSGGVSDCCHCFGNRSIRSDSRSSQSR